MKKNKKPIKELERVESFFTTDSEHRNEYSLNFYTEAVEQKLFTDLFIPLKFFWEFESIFYSRRSKPLQVSKSFFEEMKKNKWNDKQQTFILESIISFFEITEWTENEKIISAENELKKVITILETELSNIKPKSENVFDWQKTKHHLETLPNTAEKIKYLIIKKSEFQQQFGVNRNDRAEIYDQAWFDEQCEVKIKELEALEPHPIKQPIVKPQFALSKSFSKIDYIRIINALSELRCFQNDNGTIPTKQDVMKGFGDVVGVDLSSYAIDLNKAFKTNVKIEKNIEIFERMKAKTQELYLKKQEK